LISAAIRRFAVGDEVPPPFAQSWADGFYPQRHLFETFVSCQAREEP